ncbi:MAG: hypothetical protein KC643_29865 [Nitrospira sp.]|nr:hypothetical protein [Nitrospira sp.]
MKILNTLLKIVFVGIIIMMVLPMLQPLISSQIFRWQYERQKERFENYTPSSDSEDKVLGRLAEQFMEVEMGAKMAGVDVPKCRKNRVLKHDYKYMPTWEESLKECGIKP